MSEMDGWAIKHFQFHETLLPCDISFSVPAAITFNSSTANPWLSLSSSLTCVRYQTFNHAVEDNPHRFNAALSLLGSQGFTHGRHYWEIEVYSSTVWTLGVARESVPRKGVIKALPANGFWTLSLSYGVQYMAGTSHVPKHCRELINSSPKFFLQMI